MAILLGSSQSGQGGWGGTLKTDLRGLPAPKNTLCRTLKLSEQLPYGLCQGGWFHSVHPRSRRRTHLGRGETHMQTLATYKLGLTKITTWLLQHYQKRSFFVVNLFELSLYTTSVSS